MVLLILAAMPISGMCHNSLNFIKSAPFGLPEGALPSKGFISDMVLRIGADFCNLLYPAAVGLGGSVVVDAAEQHIALIVAQAGGILLLLRVIKGHTRVIPFGSPG